MPDDNVRPFRKPAGDLVARFTGTMISGVSDASLLSHGTPAIDVALTKDDRRRRYVIRVGRGINEWYCQVWFGERQHRGIRAQGVQAAQRLREEYRREIIELIADGWQMQTGDAT